ATEYSADLLSQTGIAPAKLPPLVPLGEPRGPLTAAACEHLGIGPDAMLMDATIDSVTSAVGTGAIDATRVGVIIGTTTVIVTHVPDKRHDTANGLTAAPSPVPNSWFLMAENGIGGKAFDVFVRNVVYPDDGLGLPMPSDGFDRVLAAAAASPAGANGAMFQPWLLGSMAPRFRRRMRGGFANLGVDTTRADMARAVLEGVAFNAAWLLPHVATLAGGTAPTIALGGGGAASALWGQIMSDSFGLAVRRLAHPHATNAHGAALLALTQAGHLALAGIPSMLTTEQLHQPDPAAHELYATRTAALIDFHDRVAPFYDSLPR
ncbi:MAG TPA: FGGY-family carbohydrate kinase, partial [Ilumatobacteraceae bacterium]